MKYLPVYILLVIFAVFVSVSCATAPQTAPPPAQQEQPEPEDPNQMAPGKDALDKLNEAMARAENARAQALEVQGPAYFPDEWEKAESDNEAGKKTGRDTLGEVNAAIALFNRAADTYESIAEQSGPLFAQDRENARSGLEAAMARAALSRKDAVDNNGPAYFPDDWEAAEAILQEGEDADKETLEEMNAAAALYEAAADGYDDIAGRSRPLFAKEKDDAQKALDAAIARAARSRQQAMNVDGPTYFPADWRSAEAKNQSAQNARVNTADEIQAATVLYTAAADAYDDIAAKSAPRFTADKDAALKALQAAIARAAQSRTAASNARVQANFPTEWTNAETRNQNAQNARRETIAEIKAATPLYTQAADAYDDLVRRNTARMEQETQTAKANAEKERQAAINAKAPVAAATEYNRAETLFQQATRDFTAKAATATERFNQSIPLFTAAIQAAEKKRAEAESAITAAKEKSIESIALSVSAAIRLELEQEEDNEYLTETARLIGLAEGCYAQGQYDDAIKYAQEALKYAQLSDDYIALQIKIKETDEAIAAAQERLEWAQENGAPKWYAEIYEEAENALAGALDFRSREEWDQAKASALSVIDLLAEIPEAPVYAAQYLVKNWVPLRDCLWNIAAKPEVYGDPFQWRRIYNANRSKFPQRNNPNLVLPGTLLDIPPIGDEIRRGVLEGEL